MQNTFIRRYYNWWRYLPDTSNYRCSEPNSDYTDKTRCSRQLPENLTDDSIYYEKHIDSFLVSRDAIMTNETQSEFWVMKIAGNNLAVKIPILKGIEMIVSVEILSSD